MPLGSTAAALAQHAHCPVAIVRSGGAPQTDSGWIAAVQNDEPDNDAVVHRAMEEGRLRRAPVLLIDRRVDSWVRRYPDVHVQTVATRQGRTRRDENPATQSNWRSLAAPTPSTSPDSCGRTTILSSVTPTAQCCWSARH